MVALVTKSKPIYKNVLGYDTKSKEYVYYHGNKEIWREPATDGELFKYFNTKRINNEFTDDNDIRQLKELPIYEKYSKSCQSF